MKILKSGIEITPEELSVSKAGKACACACQEGFNTATLWGGGSEETECICGCIMGPFTGTASSALSYPF